MELLFTFGPMLIFVCGLVGGLLLCAWVVWNLVGMYLMREISGAELALMVAVFLGLLASVMAVGGEGYGSVGLLVVLWLLGLSFPALQARSKRGRLRRMTRRDIATYLEALKRQPDVPFPHRRLGEIYQAQENWDKAVDHYQAYLEMHEHSGEVARKLERCLEHKRRQDLGLTRCPKCGAENPRGESCCDQCGFYLRGMAEIVDTFATPTVLRILVWVIIIAIPVGTVLSFLQTVDPAFAIIFLFFGAVAAFIYWYARLAR
jgi:hypothetical protein